MPRVQAPTKDLRCGKCEACIVSDGFITCMRCKQPVDIASAIMSGKWSCPKCPEHGEDPKTLAIDGAIKCRFCEHKNPIPNMRVKDMAETETLTLTTHYRNTLFLELEGLKFRKKAAASSFSVDDLERERIGLENSLAILDMGFDIDQFEKILSTRSGIPGKLPAHGEFDYFLPAKSGRGVKYVGLYLRPKDKKFSIVVRTPVDEFTVFALRDVLLEKISYDQHTHIGGSFLSVGLTGTIHGLPIKANIDKRLMIVKGGDLDYHMDKGPLYYSLDLEPPSEEGDMP